MVLAASMLEFGSGLDLAQVFHGIDKQRIPGTKSRLDSGESKTVYETQK